MKLIVMLVLLIAVGIVLWKWLLPAQEKAQTGTWARRAGWSLIVALILVIGAFGISSLTTWRLW